VARALLAEVESRMKSNQDNCAVLVAVMPPPAGGPARGRGRWALMIGALILLAAVAGYFIRRWS
jgi:hypothetical protein